MSFDIEQDHCGGSQTLDVWFADASSIVLNIWVFSKDRRLGLILKVGQHQVAVSACLKAC